MFFELLESRRMLSATLSAGTLTITETNGNDTVTINKSGNNLLVTESGGAHTYASASVTKINVNCGQGADKVTTQDAVTQPMVIHGGWGNDSLTGGGGADQIYGELGDDNLVGNGGNDSIYGGAGSDGIHGGNQDAAVGSHANGGDDYLDGGDGTDYIFGDDGNDVIYGGGSADIILGNQGNDQIHGGDGDDYINGNEGNDDIGDNGNDMIHGDDGNDYILGGNGNDLIYGDAGNDVVHAMAGDDDVYGGPGQDILWGEDGNDGLVGGADQDQLWGGAGADRLIQTTPANYGIGDDAIMDATSEDAVVNFRNSPAQTGVRFGGQTGTYDFAAGNWSDTEIQAEDQALSFLQHLTHNTKLLKTSTGVDMRLWRIGALTASHGGTFDAAAWNNSTGDISIAEGGINTDPNFIKTCLVHELGHNWDREWNATSWDAQSGWTTVNESGNPNFVQASDASGTWWHYKTAQFVSTYAATNPYEDFAESFSAVIAYKAGWTRFGDTMSIKDITNKWNVINSFISSQTTSTSPWGPIKVGPVLTKLV